MQFDLSILGAKSRPLIGLDISSSSIKMLELSRDGKHGYCVEHYVIERLPRDAVSDGNVVNLEETAAAVQRAWRKMESSVKQVAVAIPASQAITKKVILPSAQREENLEILVESEANQYIPFSLDEVNLDFQVLGPSAYSPEEVEVLIAASRKEKVEDRVAVAEAGGLTPVIVDIESYATLSAFELISQQMLRGGEGQLIALITVGALVMNLTVLHNDQQVYSRDQMFGGNQLTQDIARLYGKTFDEAEAEKRKNILPENYESELLKPFVENLALEVSRALQFFFTSTQYTKINHIVLAGGCAILPGVRSAVASRTQVNTIIANPFADMAVNKRVKNLKTDAPSLMVACGLALRRFDE
ncbi:MAG: pilus assembly protein PilM [Candidatus Accumulibacter sp.]|nr:pilus assembly protein PilM [Accumulibacter sp.]